MPYILAIRGELSEEMMLQQAKMINKEATIARPGLYLKKPQPFISKLEVRNGGKIIRKQFSFERHAKSSKNSPYVSFTGITKISTVDAGFRFQNKWHTREAEKSTSWRQSFLTTKSNLTSLNPFTSGLEKEILLRGHLHRKDNTMMNHIITKTENKQEDQ